MPPKNNIELGPGQIIFKGLSEPIDISEGTFTTEEKWADDVKPISIRDVMDFTMELEPIQVQFNRDWTLAYCKDCCSPFPIIQFDALICGTTGWRCPLCTTIKRMRERMAKEEV